MRSFLFSSLVLLQTVKSVLSSFVIIRFTSERDERMKDTSRRSAG